MSERLNGADSSFADVVTDHSVFIFGQMLYAFSEPNAWFDYKLTQKFNSYYEEGKISVLTTDQAHEDISRVLTLDKNPGHVAIVLYSGYPMGFSEERSPELVDSINNTAKIIKMAIDGVEGLEEKGYQFMTREEFETQVTHTLNKR